MSCEPQRPSESAPPPATDDAAAASDLKVATQLLCEAADLIFFRPGLTRAQRLELLDEFVEGFLEGRRRDQITEAADCAFRNWERSMERARP